MTEKHTKYKTDRGEAIPSIPEGWQFTRTIVAAIVASGITGVQAQISTLSLNNLMSHKTSIAKAAVAIADEIIACTGEQ